MSVAEIDSYLVDKRQRDMEINRQKRMRAFEEREAAERDPNDPAGWGGSDEEVLIVAYSKSCFTGSNINSHTFQPDEALQTLMKRTATAISRSPNPQQLEMRILANHGSDPRFAFLRGRWGRAWTNIKNPPPPSLVAKPSTNLSGLGDYDEDSGSESSDASAMTKLEPAKSTPTDAPVRASPSDHATLSEEAARAERRERAKLWAAQRRANTSLQTDS